MKELSLVQKQGFKSVDENPDLLKTYPIKSVMLKGVDLMTFRADAHPSLLGSRLRKEIFGSDGLTVDMIDSASSPNRKGSSNRAQSKVQRSFLVLFNEKLCLGSI